VLDLVGDIYYIVPRNGWISGRGILGLGIAIEDRAVMRPRVTESKSGSGETRHPLRCQAGRMTAHTRIESTIEAVAACPPGYV
jgi:hypothetical protein